MSPLAAAVLDVASSAVILKDSVAPGATVTGVGKLSALLAFTGDTVALLPDAAIVNEASTAGLLTVTATVPILCVKLEVFLYRNDPASRCCPAPFLTVIGAGAEILPALWPPPAWQGLKSSD